MDSTYLDNGVGGLSWRQSVVKRSFDVIVSLIVLMLLWWIILIAWMFSAIDTRANGFYTQQRVGRYGQLFRVVKIRTMCPDNADGTTVTCSDDPRITRLGSLLRRAKVDELPQLWNVLTGDMSLVGPRPDVPGFADLLQGDERVILALRPGITGPATLKYRNEEEFLATQKNPETYNREVIFPDKVRINMDYVSNWSFLRDLSYLWQTLLG